MSQEQMEQEVNGSEQAADAAPHEGDTTPETGAANEAAITGELRRMGERLASAIKAATGTPEAEELRGEVGDGLRKLRAELDGVLRRGRDAMPAQGSPQEPAVSEEEVAVEEAADATGTARAASVQSTVRNEIANALRSLNGALDRLAGTIAAGKSDDEDESAV